jgi:hypothetical protein
MEQVGHDRNGLDGPRAIGSGRVVFALREHR